MSDPVHLLDPSGQVVEAPADGASSLLSLGYTPASPQQIEDFKSADAYGSTGQQVIAGAEGLARGLTGRLSTAAEVAAGVDPKGITGRMEANPATANISEGVGVALPLIATMGGAAELTAPGLIARAGSMAGGRIAGGAVEGALYGAGNVVHEAALGDPNLSAQSVIAQVGLSAAMGGALGGAMGLAETAIPKVLGRARDAVKNAYGKVEGLLPKAESVTGTPADVTTLMLEHKQQISGFEHNVPGVSEDIAAATPATAKWMLDNQAALSSAEATLPGFTKTLSMANPDTAQFILDNWQLVRRDPAALNTLKTSQKESLQEVYDAMEHAVRTANSEIRPAETERFLSGPHLSLDGSGVEWADHDQVLGLGGRAALAVDRAATAMRAEPELYDSGYAAALEKIRHGLQRDITPESANAEVFQRLRTLRQQVDELIPYGKDALGMGISQRNSANALKSLRSEIKGYITNERVFGAAATREAAFNDAQSDLIRAKKEFQKRFMVKRPGASGGTAYEVDPVKINMWFNSMADPRGQIRTRAVDEFMDAGRQMLEEIEKSHAVAPVAQFDKTAVESVLNKSGRITEEARKAQTATELYKHLQGTTILGSGPVSPGIGDMATKAAGLVLPGYVTSTIKATMNVAKQATSVPKAVATLAALERAGNAVYSKIQSAVANMVKGGAGTVARGEAAAGIAREFGMDAEEASAHFDKHAEKIRSMTANPDTLQSTLEKQTGDIHEHAPQTAQAMQITSARAMAFLASKLPPTIKPGPLSEPLPMTQHDISVFNRYREAVERPMSLLKQAQAGTLTPESVEAVRAVYPQLFQKIQATVIGKLSEAKEVPYRTRLMASMIMGRDLDGSMNPQAILRAQLLQQPPPPRAAPGKPSASKAGKLHLQDRIQTTAQKAVGGEK